MLLSYQKKCHRDKYILKNRFKKFIKDYRLLHFCLRVIVGFLEELLFNFPKKMVRVVFPIGTKNKYCSIFQSIVKDCEIFRRHFPKKL